MLRKWIVISIFFWQLEKSHEVVDAANLRAAYAEVMSAELTGDTTKATTGIKVDQKQTKKDWETTIDWPEDLDVSARLLKMAHLKIIGQLNGVQLTKKL